MYDITTGMWHQKSFRNPTSSVDERARGRVAGFFQNKNYFGDYDNGRVYALSQDVYTDYGNPIVRNRTSPIVWNARERVYYDSIEIDVERGQGLATGQGSDPKLMLRWSNDSGYTYNSKRQIDLGKTGKYRTRVRLDRLGQARERVFEVTFSDPIKFNLLGFFADIS